MGFVGALVSGLASSVGQVADIAAGGPQKRARAARDAARAQQAQAEAQVKAAQISAQTAQYAADAQLALEREKASNLQKIILVGGGIAILGAVVVGVMRK